MIGYTLKTRTFEVPVSELSQADLLILGVYHRIKEIEEGTLKILGVTAWAEAKGKPVGFAQASGVLSCDARELDALRRRVRKRAREQAEFWRAQNAAKSVAGLVGI